MKRKVLSLFLCAAIFGTALVGCGTSKTASSTSTSSKKSKGYVIGFSNSFNGNSYRQKSEAWLKEASAKLVKDGTLKEDVIFAEANQNVATQVQQIESFITQKVDAIVIDPGSTAGLDGAIEKASKAGIPCIIVNDGPVTSKADRCYQINCDLKGITGDATEYICGTLLKGKGNIIELRGQAGTSSDALMHQGVTDVLKKYPDIKVVSSIYTDWTSSKAQSELASVLPTLNKVDAVVTQGGDSYAAVQAFKATGKPLPIIAGDNRGTFLKWWNKEAPQGYDTISTSSNPWCVAAGLYEACDILSGVNVPKTVTFPNGIIKKADIAKYASIDEETIGCPTYDRAWLKDNLYK